MRGASLRSCITGRLLQSLPAAPSRPGRPRGAGAPCAECASPEARRQQLIDSARRLFAERGFNGTTTREIAAAAGVTEAVIFQHFSDKDSLYAAILAQQAADPEVERLIEALTAAAAAQDDERLLRVLYDGLIDYHDRDPHYLRLTLYSALEHHPLSTRRHAFGMRLSRPARAATRPRRPAGGTVPFRLAPPHRSRAIPGHPHLLRMLQNRVLRTPFWPAVDRRVAVDDGVCFALGGLRADAPRGGRP